MGDPLTSGEREILEERIVALDRLTDAKFVTFRTLVDSQAEKVALALSAAEKAISKAETATEKRFDSVNEFRQTLTDQAGQFITRMEFDQFKETVTNQLYAMDQKFDAVVKPLSEYVSSQQGRTLGQGALVAMVVQVLVIAIAVAAILIGNN